MLAARRECQSHLDCCDLYQKVGLTSFSTVALGPLLTYSCSPARFFSKGHCRWGDGCRFSHDFPSASLPTTAPSLSATGVALMQHNQQQSGLPAMGASELTTADTPVAGYATAEGGFHAHQHGSNQQLQQQQKVPPGLSFEFKPGHASLGLQTPLMAPGRPPSLHQGHDGKSWNATDIANSSPFPGVGNGLPRKLVP